MQNNINLLNFEEMKINEIKTYCKENNIKGISGLKKSNIIDKIKKHNINIETILENNNSKNDDILNNYDKLNKTNKSIKFIDLFCGIGGFHIALKELGCECILACDIDKKCRETYLKNFNFEPLSNIKDIDEKKIPDFDILCGGLSTI